jgi:hypothetical protein
VLKSLLRSASLGYQSISALYWDRLTTRRLYSSKARSALRDSYFQSRAKIGGIALADFCAQFQSEPPEVLALPTFCGFKNHGIGTPNYFLALAAISAVTKPEQIVEFGTFLGASAAIFALNAPRATILTIDLPDDPGELPKLDRTDTSHVNFSRGRVGQLFRGTPQAERIAELKCDSRRLQLSEHVGSADLIYVDGGHNLECITADTENAFSVAHRGSVILWDDYFWFYPDVVTFLDRLGRTRQLVRINGTNLVAHICENSSEA